MMKLTLKPEARVTNSYHGKITILEGGELRALEKEFHRQMKLLKKKPDFEERIWLAAPFAYQALYGKHVLCKEDLRLCRTADARKMDLFYRYAHRMVRLATAGKLPKGKAGGKI